MRAPYRLTRTWMLCLAALSCAPEAGTDTSSRKGPGATLTQALTPVMSAQYDAQLSAPACRNPGPACDSNTTLTGRGPVGPESNAPNTLGGSCADGADGTFHADASVDALRVSTVDGVSYLAEGRTVKVEADVWGAPSGGSALMFFQAADAQSPQWVHLATLPTTGGAQTLSTTFTLPAGGLQAVRAALVDASLAQNEPCTPGAVHDHDDLAFQVSAPDTTPPTLTSSSPVNGGTYSGTVRFVAEATDNQAMGRVDFFFNGTDLAGSDSEPPYELVWDSSSITGANQFVWFLMRATDAVGNSADAYAWLWVSNDGAPPTVTLTSPTNQSFVRDPLDLVANAYDDIGIAQVEFYLDDTVLLGSVPGAPNTYWYNIPWNPQTAPGGIHTLTARATDTSGKATTSAPVTVIVNRPPTVTLTSPAEGSVLTGSVVLTASVTDTTGVDHVSLYDEAGHQLCEGYNPPDYACFWHTRNQPNGPIRVRFVARDSVGNEGSSAWVSFTLDNDFTPPTLTVTAPSEGATVSGDVVLSADASDDRGDVYKVEFLVDESVEGSDTTAPFSLTWPSTRVLNGAHKVSARVWDMAGNMTTSAVVNITTDNDFTPPTVAFTSPVEGATLSGSVTLSATASDDRSGISFVVVSVVGQRQEIFTSPPYELSLYTRNYPNGTYTLVAEAYDGMGNKASTSRSVTIDNDRTPPTVAVTSPTPGTTLRGTVTLSANASDDRSGISRVEFRMNNGSQGYGFTATTSAPYTYTLNTRNYPNGTYTLWAEAVDGSGLYGIGTSMTVTLDNDKTAPVVSLTSPASGSTLQGTVTLSATASDDRAVSKVEFYLGTALLAADTSAPYEFSLDTRGYSNGSYSVTAKAYDGGGNVSNATASITLDNDFTPPNLSILSPSASTPLSGTVPFEASASDARSGISRVELYVGNTLLTTDTSAPYVYELNTRDYANGTHTLMAKAYDGAGNTSTVWRNVTVSNDSTPPTVSLTSPAANSTLLIGSSYTLTASATDNVGISRVEFYLDGMPLGTDSVAPYALSWTNTTTTGSHDLYARAYDAAGNATNSPSVTVSVQYPSPTNPNTFAYSASNTSSATMNTSNLALTLSAGQKLTLGTCGVTGASFTGDTYLRLYNPSGTQVVSNDDACGGVGSNFTYTVPAGAGGTYQLRAGCYSSGSCSGTVAWTLQ